MTLLLAAALAFTSPPAVIPENRHSRIATLTGLKHRAAFNIWTISDIED
jgi:hypothetical protein